MDRLHVTSAVLSYTCLLKQTSPYISHKNHILFSQQAVCSEPLGVTYPALQPGTFKTKAKDL